MVVIAVDKLFAVYKPLLARSFTVYNRLHIVLACGMFALFWALMPLVGWSHYSMEASRTTCSVEWAERSVSVTSYNMAIFFFVFLLPVSVIVVVNFKLVVFLHAFFRNRIAFVPIAKQSHNKPNSYKSIQSLNSFTRLSEQPLITPKTVRTTIIMLIYIGKNIIRLFALTFSSLPLLSLSLARAL